MVDHAFPFASTRSNISRPPMEESMHDHWKNTASLAPAQKKNRSNCIAHLEDCFPSLQRVKMLQEISIKSRGLRLTGSFEASSSPLLFFNGVSEIEDGLQTFVSIVSNIPNVATDVDHSVERYLQQPSSISDVSSHSVFLYVLSVQCTDQVPLNIGRILTRRNGCIVSTTDVMPSQSASCWSCCLKGLGLKGFVPRSDILKLSFVFPSDPPRKSLPMGM